MFPGVCRGTRRTKGARGGAHQTKERKLAAFDIVVHAVQLMRLIPTLCLLRGGKLNHAEWHDRLRTRQLAVQRISCGVGGVVTTAI